MKFVTLAALAGVALAVKPRAATSYTSSAASDLVTSLPGLTAEINFNHFSGYLDIPGIAGPQKHVHYWFVEASEVDPLTAPTVFWTNGGPGCSGLLGMLTEQGPFRPDGEGNVHINDYAWNRIANVVFYEQPAGVGYSYPDNDKDLKTNDDIASADTYAAIQEFYKKFPEYLNNDLFISSESYGGHYAPRFTDYIVEQNKKGASPQLPIRGFAVGNPFNDWNAGTPTMLKTLWGHQLVSAVDWNKYETDCLNSSDPKAMASEECELLEVKLTNEMGDINPYALDYPICTSTNMQGRWLLKHVLPEHLKKNILGEDLDYNPCGDSDSTLYMNDPAVQAALHVNSSIVWEECSNTVKYAFSNEFLSMTQYYPKLVNEGMKVLVYSGDDDGVCGTQGTQDWIWGLGYRVTSSWKQWTLNGQPSGFLSKFDTSKTAGGKLAFLTVHGAGHEVPTYKPEAAFELFQSFLDESIF